jgi:MarR family transcriptional regulator, transcriptional regulator for hemolysin
MERMRNFYFLLKDVAQLTSRNFERHAADVQLGLTLAQCRVLVYLERNEGVSQVRLAYLTDTDPMTLVRILDRMERDGWVERRPDPADRRARRLYLKPAAVPVLKQIWAIGDRSRMEALAGLTNEHRGQLLDLLGRIHTNLSTVLVGTAEPTRPPLPSPRQASKARVRGSASARPRKTGRSKHSRVSP